MNKAVFFDRDGTLIKDQNYLSDPNQVVLDPNAIKALKALQEHNYKLIMVTNQSGIARGLFPLYKFFAVQSRLIKMFSEAGIIFQDFYYCPHHPEGKVAVYAKSCCCRKPAPGMILKACTDHNINPLRSFMIGDKLDDVIAGNRAGVKTIFFTNNFKIESSTVKPNFWTNNLLDAVHDFILKNEENPSNF
ncbi:MAG: HAD family hydrolase [Candidatus Margulisiibacteriota bacterium]|jgi:histidinol-phosphate phosphatase family protein